MRTPHMEWNAAGCFVGYAHIRRTACPDLHRQGRGVYFAANGVDAGYRFEKQE